MKADHWDKLCDRGDPDVDSLLGERFAAHEFLKIWIAQLDPAVRQR